MKLRAGLSPRLGLLLLSALWALDWLVPDLFPGSAPNVFSLPARQAILFSAFAVVTASLALMQRIQFRRVQFPRGRLAWASAGIGLGFFVIPTSAAAFARDRISSLDAAAVFCLTPVFAVVLEPYLQDCSPRKGRAALAGALVAIAGILFLFPLETPSSWREAVALLVLLVTAFGIAATNCVAVRLAHVVPSESTLPMTAMASGVSAIGFALAAAFTPNTPWNSTALQIFFLRSFLIDIPGLFLLFWLIRRLSASRMTARFLLAPLLASLAGLALERTWPPLRGLFGLVLLACGSGWLVFAPAESQDEEQNPLFQRQPDPKTLS